MSQFQLNTRSDFAADKPNLLKLLKTLKDLTEELEFGESVHFNMDLFCMIEDDLGEVCHTSGCAFGWFVIRNPGCGYKIDRRDAGQIVPDDYPIVGSHRDRTFNEWDFAQKLFRKECNGDEEFLFSPDRYILNNQATTLENVIHRVEHMLNGGDYGNYDYSFGKRYNRV